MGGPKLRDSRHQSVLTPLTEEQASHIPRNIDCMRFHLNNGYIGKATKALVQQASIVKFNADNNRLQQLHDTHPTPLPTDFDHYTNLPRCPSTSSNSIVDADAAFKRCINELANGSAPGPSEGTF